MPNITLAPITPLAALAAVTATPILTLAAIAPAAAVAPVTVFDSHRDDNLYVNSVLQGRWLANTFRLTRRVGARDTGQYSTRYLTGDTAPSPGDDVVLVHKGVRVFGGLLESYTDIAIDAHDEETRVDVQLSGYSALLDTIVVKKLYTIFLGGLVSIIMFDIWQEHLASKGVTFNYFRDGDPAIDLGPMLFHYISGTEVVNQLMARVPGWSIWIDENKELRIKRTDGGASANAPFSIADGSANWDSLSVTKSRSRMRNRQWVLPSKDLAGLFTELFAGDGARTVFPTLYQQDTAPIIYVNGVRQVVTAEGAWIGGYQVWYVPGGTGVFFVSAPGSTLVVSIQYPSPFSLAVSVDDAASIAANGLIEAAYQAKDVDSVDVALELAQGLIDMNKDMSEGVSLTWSSGKNDKWLLPGHVMTIAKTKPALSGQYGVQEVQSSEQDMVVWRHSATLSKGPDDTTDAQQNNELLVASRVSANGKQVQFQFLLGADVVGLTNPGITTGVSTEFQVMPKITGGVKVKGWSLVDPVDPPTGAALIVDITVDGSSIYGVTKPTLPSGQTTPEGGFEFANPDTIYVGGEIVRTNVIQVGSTTPGKNAMLTLVLVG